MDGELEKKKKARITSGEDEEEEEEEDRISRLPDDLLHRILKFVNTKLGVQTSALSKRWKFVWTTLPFLKFEWDQVCAATNTTNLTRHVLNHRNHQSQISSLEIAYLPTSLIVKFIEYAISHHVQDLNVQFRSDHKPFKLSNFSSNSIRKLVLRMKPGDSLLESDCWDLPALSTLHFKCYVGYISIVKWVEDKLLEQYLICLPALRDLWLQHWDLQSFAFSLPELTTLLLRICKLPNKVWNLPALKSLTLDEVDFPENTRDLFTALVNLQNLTLSYNKVTTHNCFITCPELVNLEIKTLYKHFYGIPKCTIVVFAPKLSNFTSVGIFPITFEESKLDNVNVKLRGWTDDKYCSREELKKCYRQFTVMLPGFGSAKILNLDLEVIEALLLIFDFLASFSSPFYALKCVKLPHGCNEASISNTLRSYLLGGSPTATIVTALPQNMNSCTNTATTKAQNVVLQDPLGAQTKVLVNSEYLQKTVCVDTADTGVQDELMGQDSLLDSDSVRQIGAPVERTEKTGNDHVSSSGGDNDFGIWRGHEVKSEFVCLLELISNKYPETFEHFTTKNKKFCTLKLNQLCTSVNDFTRISMTDVDTEMIAEYRDVFVELQKFGFNVSWLVNRLNYIEQIRFSQPLLSELHSIDCLINDAKSKLQEFQIHIDDTKTKLKDLQSLRIEKMQQIQKVFGTFGTNLLVGYIGDDLLSSP